MEKEKKPNLKPFVKKDKKDNLSPEDNSDFIIVRHGATKNNEQGLNRGMLNLELAEKGKQEARDIAPKVAEKGVTVLIASPLLRAQQTAKIISEKTGIPVVETNKALLPWAIGEFQGKSIKDTLPELHNYIDNPDKVIPGGGESFNQYRERAVTGLKKIHEDHPNEKIGLVSHHRLCQLIEAYTNEKNGHGNFHLSTQKLAGIDPGNIAEFKWKDLFPERKNETKDVMGDYKRIKKLSSE